jgi:glutaredoxin
MTPTPPRPIPAVTVYTRAGCGCCKTAIALLEDRRRDHPFALELVDVDGDPALVAEHGDWVPVVAVGGKVRFRGKVEPVLLDRLLHAFGRGDDDGVGHA